MSRFKQLVVEIHRRSLWQILGAYLAGAWIVMQAADTATAVLGLPDWFPQVAAVICAIGLPVILATAIVQKGFSRSAATADSSARGARRWLRWRTATAVIVMAFVLLGAAVSSYMAMRAFGIGPVGSLLAKGVLEPRERIVLSDFESQTGDTLLGLAVTEAFRTDFSQSTVVRLAERDYVGQVLELMEREAGTRVDYDVAREVAIREGLKAVIAGEVNSVGASFVLSTRLVAVETGEVLAAFRETADDSTAVISAIDGLSKKLRERVGESLRSIRRDEPLERATTASLQALRKYSQGVRAIWVESDRDRGIGLLEEAVALDTTFAMAYSLLGVASAQLQDRERAVWAFTKSLEYSGRLPDRERYMVQASYYRHVTREEAKAIAALETLLDVYPDHREALNVLAVSYYLLGDLDRAEEIFSRVRELESPDLLDVTHFTNIVWVQADLGKIDEATANLGRARNHFPENPWLDFYEANLESSQGRYTSAEELYRALRDSQRGSLSWRATASRNLAYLAQVRGRLADAEHHYREAAAAQAERGLLRSVLLRFIDLGWLHAWTKGATDRGVQVVEEALDRFPVDSIEPLNRPYLQLSNFYAVAGQPEASRALIAQHEAAVDTSTLRAREPSIHRAEGFLALAEGRYAEAISEYLQYRKGVPYCTSCALFEIGWANDRAGERDSALTYYERFVTTPRFWRIPQDKLYLPVVYERLGALYEDRGEPKRAVYYYGKLIELWKDADPELQPRVEAARRAIVALSTDT